MARARVGLAIAVAIFVGVSQLEAAGFGSQPQSARAMGTGGAFVARTDDPSAIFYNPGALGILGKKKGLSAGAALSQFNESLYQGLPPGLGIGTTAEQEPKLDTLPFAFATLPLGDRIVSGIGVYTPYRMRTQWADPETFAGRFIATESELMSYDVTATFGLKVTDTFGIGGGAIYRTSQLKASRRLGAALSGTQRDIGTLELQTDNESQIGWNAGLLHRASSAFSWGLNYRSKISTDYIGVGELTQIATGDTQFDQLIAASFPFGSELPLVSALEFPAEATLGIAIGSKPLLFEIDVTRTEWSNVSEIPFLFANSALDTRYRLDFHDTTDFRAGFQFMFPTGHTLRAGFAREESPQPAQTVGAFLPDAGRSIYTAGYGLDWLDIAVAWTTYDQRITANNVDNLNGNWRANSWSVLVTATK